MSTSLHHGGRLRAAAHHYRIPLQHWLDLSTGISPWGWPVPPMPEEVWRCLPEDDDGLRMACLAYFNGISVLPVAGSQAAIQALPELLSPRRIGILSPCYAEHERAWQNAGHTIMHFGYSEAEAAVSNSDVVVLTNPNNPTGQCIPHDTLLEWHDTLQARQGLLVVDEAFMDARPDQSILPHAGQTGLVVLRSLGKFYGLAGLRCGFVAAEETLLTRLADRLGPWAVSHPARWVAQRALADRPWQLAQTHRLTEASARLTQTLADVGLPSQSGCELFRWVACEHANVLYEALARRGILVRCFSQGLRFGLPATEHQWDKLSTTLKEIMQ